MVRDIELNKLRSSSKCNIMLSIIVVRSNTRVRDGEEGEERGKCRKSRACAAGELCPSLTLY